MQVGDLEYDHARGLLSKDGVTVRLSTGKRRDVWFLFANNANNVVTYADIRRHVYADRVVVTDENMRQHIYWVRVAIKRLNSRCKIANWGFGTWELITGDE
jgi:DNA-binding winged helix-turn-helix (wHTH) protein